MHLRQLLSEEEYRQKRQELQAELASLKLKLADTEDRAAKWLELTERAFIFANLAQKKFNAGTEQDRREIFSALGSNFILKDRTITVKLQKPFELLQSANAKSEQSGITPQLFALGRPLSTQFELLVDKVYAFFASETNSPGYIPNLRACS